MNDTEFQRLVDAHYAALYRFGLSLAKSQSDAADLTQQTFYLWAAKGDQLRDRSKAKSWLFTTLYREFLHRQRRDVRFPHVELEATQEEPATVAPNLDQLDSAAVLQALAQVEEPFRAPLTLFYLEQFSYAEIAHTLDVPIGTVMSRLSRGKNQLRQRLLSVQEMSARNIVPLTPQEERTGHGQ
jgi:RNA polymerase sigma factor (sigma-70 family)